jgi:hypothetical protein
MCNGFRREFPPSNVSKRSLFRQKKRFIFWLKECDLYVLQLVSLSRYVVFLSAKAACCDETCLCFACPCLASTIESHGGFVLLFVRIKALISVVYAHAAHEQFQILGKGKGTPTSCETTFGFSC